MRLFSQKWVRIQPRLCRKKSTPPLCESTFATTSNIASPQNRSSSCIEYDKLLMSLQVIRVSIVLVFLFVILFDLEVKSGQFNVNVTFLFPESIYIFQKSLYSIHPIFCQTLFTDNQIIFLLLILAIYFQVQCSQLDCLSLRATL